MHHASAWSTWVAVGPPSTRARDADTTTDRGWCSANGWSQPGIVATGTNADEAKTSGAMSGKAAACAVSGSPTARPTAANTHDSAYPNSTSRASAPRRANALVCTRKPTAKPTAAMSATTSTLRTASASVRPARTADRAIASDRKRSMRPVLTSAASPIAVFMEPKATVWANTPGMRKSTYGTPGTWIAPPKT